MSAEKHTPGTWEWVGAGLETPVPSTVLDCGEFTAARPTEADACLIAAAPELLEAAEAGRTYRNALAQCANDPARMTSFCTAEGADLDALFDRWEQLTEAAIAKATGSTS